MRKFSETAAGSLNVLGANACRQLLRNVCFAREGAHVPRDLDNQTGVLNQQRTAAPALCALRLHCLRVLVIVDAEKLPQVRMEGTVPSDGKDFSDGRDIFPDGYTGCSLNLVQGVGIAGAGTKVALHFRVVGANRCDVAAQ